MNPTVSVRVWEPAMGTRWRWELLSAFERMRPAAGKSHQGEHSSWDLRSCELVVGTDTGLMLKVSA